MVAAICLQESRFSDRRQIRGPARGWAQFEEIGVEDVCINRSTARPLREALRALSYESLAAGLDHSDASHQRAAYRALHRHLETSDVLAIVFARLALWKLPTSLPALWDPDLGWDQYIWVWRPGKPHHATWLECWEIAGRLITAHFRGPHG